MPFEAPPKPKGDWINMSDLAKVGATLVASKGFLIHEPNNVFKGDTVPRYVVQVKEKTTGDDVKVSCPIGGYGRETFFEALSKYLDEHPDETVDFKFVGVAGSKYVDVEQA